MKPLLLTSDMLLAICPTLIKDRAAMLAVMHNQICPQYGIITPKQLQAFIATEATESKEFASKTESMNYSPEGLISTFSYYKKNPALAGKHGRTAIHPADQEAIANTVYNDANRPLNRKLGNVRPGDGFRFIAGGYGGMTGRDMYTKYSRYVRQDIALIAKLVHTEDRWALDSACFIFAIEKSLLDEAEKGQFKIVSERIAGSDIAMDRRQEYYARAKSVIK